MLQLNERASKSIQHCSNMNSVVFLCFFLLISLAKSETPFSSIIGNARNHPSGLLRRFNIKIQPKVLVDECLDCQPFPTPSDLNVHRLTKLIRGPLDDNLVSITKPANLGLPTELSLCNKREDLREFVLNSTKQMKNFGGALSTDQETFLVTWLQKLTSCPLKQVWRDMGPFSWPRFIKRAYCGDKRCSLLPKMHCVPSSRQFFPVLRWYCLRAGINPLQFYPKRVRQNVVRRKGFFCRWIRYNHPITTGCSCGCQS